MIFEVEISILYSEALGKQNDVTVCVLYGLQTRNPWGDPHNKVTGMLVVSLWGVNFCRFWSHFYVFGMERHYVCPFRYRLVLYIKKFTKNALTLTTQKSPLGVSLNLSHTHIGVLRGLIWILQWTSPSLLNGSPSSPPPPPPQLRPGTHNPERATLILGLCHIVSSAGLLLDTF